MKIICSFLILFLVGACMQNVNKEIEAETLLQTDKDFAAVSIKLGAAKAFRQYLTQDAIQMPQGRMPVYGNENIFNMMKENDETIILQWEPQFAEVSDNADMGWTWGLYKVLSSANNAELSTGKYLNVWKKQTDGTWKVRVDIGNTNSEQAE